MKITAILVFLCFFLSASAQQKNDQTSFPEASQFANSVLTYKLIDAANKTIGYDIYSDNKLFIHQPNIPGMSGNEGFKTKVRAEKAAQLVIEKIKKGEMPPTLSAQELKKWKLID